MQRTQSIDSEHRLNGNGNSEGPPFPGDYGVTLSSRRSKKAKIVDNEEDGCLLHSIALVTTSPRH
jgi:hypothetical protein